MTLLVPMYHRASGGRFGNDPAMLDAHFAVLAERCRCVLPGEPLAADRRNVCLSFDDATVDFYAVVFPLLRRHRLRALLAVPVSFIGEASPRPLAERVQACASRGDAELESNAYCSWPELAEMAASGLVAIAAHGLTHRRLDLPDADLHAEVVVPKTILAARTTAPVDSYVLPFGRFSPAALALARKHYRYVFRIGGADNGGWNAGLLYRFDADEMASAGSLLSPRRLFAYRLRRHWNALRSR